MNTSWVEISGEKLKHNLRQFKALLSHNTLLSVCVKANAYGHGLVECAKFMAENGADWLNVNALYEAERLRKAGIKSPIYVMGYVPLSDLHKISELDLRVVAYNLETLQELEKIGKTVRVHLKLETGNNRQGVREQDLPLFEELFANTKFVQLEGAATHFANIEDTLDHSFAMEQLEKFKRMANRLNVKIKHCANSAATMLFPETHFDMVRLGISAYGMWPSNETRVSMKSAGKKVELKPFLTWKTIVGQIKTVPEGEYIGYGCSYRAGRDVRVAILPVGYYDGYDRGLSNQAYVLIRGKRAPVRGRVCMNIIMADVTDIPEAKTEDEVVLLGAQGEDEISAEQLGSWIGTINYEITTR
ncbi:alanine racemase, partial [Candidatus Peregrinibacteria bacterium RIFOXYC2_FULL_41_22]